METQHTVGAYTSASAAIREHFGETESIAFGSSDPTVKTNSLIDAEPTVTVVIAAYNAATFIRHALDALFAQTYSDFEVIVVNDGSPDSTELEIALLGYGDRIRYFRERHRGVSAARNVGIRNARGSVYAQLDADDRWEPDYLAYQVRFLSRHPEVDLIYPNARVFEHWEDHGMDFMSLSPSRGEPTLAALLEIRCTVMSHVTARMAAIRAVGGFDESISHCEDFDLWARMSYAGSRFAYHRRKLVHYRRSGNSLSSNAQCMLESQLRVLEKSKRTMQLSPHQWSALRKGERKCKVALHVLLATEAFHDDRIDGARMHLREVVRTAPNAEALFAYLLLSVIPSALKPMLAVRRILRRWYARIRINTQDNLHAT